MQTTDTPKTAYPLTWPSGCPRTAADRREHGSFKGTMDEVRTELISEIDHIALGREARTRTIRHSIIISSNLQTRRDGFPYADAASRRIDDPGAAVYFERKGKPVCFACDKYDTVWKNLRAIQRTVEALRGIERWGSSQLLERAFTGFLALPAPIIPVRDWHDVLGLPRSISATKNSIEQAFRELSQKRHPDHGGTHDAQAELNRARQEALAEL